MLSLPPFVRSALPPWLLRAFGVSDFGGRKGSSIINRRTPEQRAAWETYDSLNGDPNAVINLPTFDSNGARRVVRTSVAQLAVLSPDHVARKQGLERALAAFTGPGWYVDRKLPESDKGAILTGQWRGNRGSLEQIGRAHV